jgi:hypothetical protein
MDFDLIRPTGLDEESWNSIVNHRDRLQSSVAQSDRSLVLGRAKELAECVGKVALTERGETPSSSITFPQLVNQAHTVLKRQPGRDLSHDPRLQALISGVMKIVKDVGEIRNSFGSGHGRQREPVVEQEMVDVVVPSTMLWVRWALGRIEPLIFGQPAALIRDLLGGTSFYRGDLAERLLAADLSNLEDAIQQRVGAAVAERAMRDTFNVRNEGVDACAESDSLTTWPLHYRRGLVEGLLFDQSGNVRTNPAAMESISMILAVVPDQTMEVQLLLDNLGSTSITMGDSASDIVLISAIKEHARRLDPAARHLWLRITSHISPF